MDLSRRQLSLLVPLLTLHGATPEEPTKLTSRNYHPDQSIDLAGKPKKGSRIFFGAEHSGFQLEMHETVLAPGIESHPPHHHVHEEIMVVLDGTVQTYVEGKLDNAEKGAVIYFASNQMHKVANVGQTPCRYYVLELRGAVPATLKAVHENF